MGFCTTTFEPENALRENLSSVSKSASREIFSSNRNHVYQIERNPLETQQEKLNSTYKTASGRSSWLGRDPIEEYGGINLYAFVGNDPANWWDYLGGIPAPAQRTPAQRRDFWKSVVAGNQVLRRRYKELQKELGDSNKAIDQLYEESLDDDKIQELKKEADLRLKEFNEPCCKIGTVSMQGEVPGFGLDWTNLDNPNPIIELSTDVNNPAKGSSKHGGYNIIIEGGDCDAYTFSVQRTVHPDDKGSSPSKDFYQGNKVYNPKKNNRFGIDFTLHNANPFVGDTYKDKLGKKKKSLLLIKITGTKDGEPGRKSVKKYWAQ